MTCSPDDNGHGRPIPFDAASWRQHMDRHTPIRRKPPDERHHRCTTLSAVAIALAVVSFVLVMQTRAELYSIRKTYQAQTEENVKLIARMKNLEAHQRAGSTTKP